MNMVTAALRRPVTVIVAVIATVIGSFFAITQMPRDVFPSLGVPTIYVAQPYGGVDPAQMEGFLTYYYEYHFLYITGIEHVESKSVQGNALIKLQFHPGTEMSQAMAETVAYVNRARAFMPAGTVPPFVTRFDAGSVPVGNLVFSSETRTVGELQDAALNKVRPLFATLPGVSAPPPFGGSARSIVIHADPERLRAYQMTPDEVVAAITSANTILPSGNLRMGDTMAIVPTNAIVTKIKDLESVPIRVGTSQAVFVRDIGTVEDGSDISTGYALVNGRRTVYIPVTKRADASTLSVVTLVKASLGKFQAVLPDDVKVTYEFDQSSYVTGAISNLVTEGAIGAILTGLMVLLFLRDWRSAIIVILNIPLSLAAAVLAIWISGQTINLMTLGGLALAVGILVDEATVTIENMHSQLEAGFSVGRAATRAGAETALARFLAMLCVLAVFTPAFFMSGAAKALFVPLSLAVGFSMVASFLLSSTLVPVLSVWLLKTNSHGGTGLNVSGIQDFVSNLVGRLRRIRWAVISLYLLLSIILVALVGSRLGTEIFPSVDSGQFQLRLKAPTGTRIEKTEAVALRTLEVIKQEVGEKNVALTLGFVGVQAPSYPINTIYLWTSGPEEAVLQIQLKQGAGVSVEGLKERLRTRLATAQPGVRFSFEPSDLVSRVMSFGSTTPVEIAVSGPALADNQKFAEKIRTELETVNSLRDLQLGQSLDYPTVTVTMDRERAGILGVTAAEIARSTATATSSSRFTAPNYWPDPKTGIAYQVQVDVPITKMNSVEALQNIPVGNKPGTTTLLRDVASISKGLAVGEYARYNSQRMITVVANIAGSDLGTVSREVEQVLSRVGVPPQKISVAVRGQVPTLQSLLGGLRSGLLVAVLAIFLLLAANFQSMRLPVVVISTVPAVLVGAVFMLWLTKSTINLESFMGSIMAIGVSVANAILVVSFAEKYRHDGNSSDLAAALAIKNRVRPVLMTSLAMIAGMVPMSLGLGEGGQQTAPLGRAVIGGLIAATFATLFLLPSIFAAVQRRTSGSSGSLDPNDPTSANYDLETHEAL